VITKAKILKIGILLTVISSSQSILAAEDKSFDKGLDAYNKGEFDTAKKIITPLVAKGDTAALNLMGMMYELGHGVSKDASKSVVYYRKAAKKGYSFAQYNLAVSYDTGSGVALNYREAVKWYKLAAQQGASFAQYNLGVMYEQGRGTKQDYKKAVYWYKKAAEQGQSSAQNNLGWLYEEGLGVKRDLVSSYVWLDLAVKQGMDSAHEKRDVVKLSLTKEQLKRAERTERKIASHTSVAKN
jgi:TPR repeat protein